MTLALGTLVILVAIYAILRRVDVRLVLFVAALVLGSLAMNPWAIVREFFTTFANERYVVPICMAMGFAYVLRHTGCDQHLVHLLVKPLTKVRWLLIPGTIGVGFVVNIPIISQTSTAATLGPVVIPILTAARISPLTIGATLVLGCSIGGELLNPGAPELRTVVEESRKAYRAAGITPPPLTERDCVQRLLPLNLLGLVGATGLFWWLSSREEAKRRREAVPQPPDEATSGAEEVADFKVNYLKAAVPFLPLLLLLLTGPPLNLITVPTNWLVSPAKKIEIPAQVPAAVAVVPEGGLPAGVPWGLLAALVELDSETVTLATPLDTGLYNSRLIGLAMLIGVLAAAVISAKSSLTVPRAFFEGAGYAFANIVSLIVTANCFALAIREIGMAEGLGTLIETFPFLLMPAAGALPLGFALLCGSGMAATAGLFGFFAGPAVAQEVDLALVGSVVSLASAAGRTMSPVAAVMLMCATLTGTSPFDLFRRVAPPLFFGITLIVIAATIMTMMG